MKKKCHCKQTNAPSPTPLPSPAPKWHGQGKDTLLSYNEDLVIIKEWMKHLQTFQNILSMQECSKHRIKHIWERGGGCLVEVGNNFLNWQNISSKVFPSLYTYVSALEQTLWPWPAEIGVTFYLNVPSIYAMLYKVHSLMTQYKSRHSHQCTVHNSNTQMLILTLKLWTWHLYETCCVKIQHIYA